MRGVTYTDTHTHSSQQVFDYTAYFKEQTDEWETLELTGLKLSQWKIREYRSSVYSQEYKHA